MNRLTPSLLSILFFTGCSVSRDPIRFEAEAVWTEMKEALQQDCVLPALPKVQVHRVGEEILISCDLEEASLSSLVLEILERSGLEYFLEAPLPPVTVSARLVETQIQSALRDLLSAHYLEARFVKEEKSPFVLITDSYAELSTPYASDKVTKEMLPEHLSSSGLYDQLLVGKGQQSGLWPAGNPTGLTFGLSPESNRLFAYGPRHAVQTAAQMIRRADQKIPEITFDIAFIFLQEELKEFYQLMMKGRGGKVVDLLFGATNGTAFTDIDLVGGLVDLAFFSSNAAPFAFKTSPNLQAFIGRLQQRIVSRSQVKVLSGQTGSLNIGRQGYLLISTFAPGLPSLDAVQISTGQVLSLTPTVLPSGKIYTTISLESSQFEDNSIASSSIVGNKFQNKVTTTMQLNDGEPILIGGYAGYLSSLSRSGYASLREVPILNLLTDGSRSTLEEGQVLFVLVPRIRKETSHRNTVIQSLHSRYIERHSNLPPFDDPEGTSGLYNSSRRE